MSGDRHDIELRDIAAPYDDRCPDDCHRGALVVSYNTVRDHNATYTEARYVSARLPVECLALFEGGTIDVADLTDEERDWLQSASADLGNEIDFAGVDA